MFFAPGSKSRKHFKKAQAKENVCKFIKINFVSYQFVKMIYPQNYRMYTMLH